MKDSVRSAAASMAGINELAMKGEIVIFGSTYMAQFPFYELVNKGRLEHAVYNRSIAGMTVAEAEAVLERCVLALRPGKVFLALGEEEHGAPESIAAYNRIVARIREELPAAKLYLLCVADADAAAFNENIASLCDGRYVFSLRLREMGGTPAEQYKARFKELSGFFRDGRIAFSDVFAMVEM